MLNRFTNKTLIGSRIKQTESIILDSSANNWQSEKTN